MNLQTRSSLERLHLYLDQVEYSLDAGNREEALANLAELGEISRRLWSNLAKQERIKKFIAEIR